MHLPKDFNSFAKLQELRARRVHLDDYADPAYGAALAERRDRKMAMLTNALDETDAQQKPMTMEDWIAAYVELRDSEMKGQFKTIPMEKALADFRWGTGPVHVSSGLPFYPRTWAELNEGREIELSIPELPTDPLWCRECRVTNLRSAWIETSLPCSDCGEHAALRCPACETTFDLVFNNLGAPKEGEQP